MKVRWHFIFSMTFFLAAVVAGSFAYVALEAWRFLDALYFTVMTVTTIGYGDFVPLTDAGKIFTIFFSFFGVAMAFYFVGLLGKELFRKHVSGEVTQIKKEVKKEKELKEDLEEIKEDIVSGKKKKKKKKKS